MRRSKGISSRFFLISWVFIIMLYAGGNVAFAQVATVPSIISVSSLTWSHGESVSITGSNFGTKNPAAPLIWDDGEDKTVDSSSALQSVYDHSNPTLSIIPDSHKIQYRGIPYRNTTGPHRYSTKYIVGGHYPYYDCGSQPARDVQVTKAAASYQNTWYASWYVRLDPNWTSPCGDGANYKTWIINEDTSAYGGITSMYSGVTGNMCTHQPTVTVMPSKWVVYNGQSYGNSSQNDYSFKIWANGNPNKNQNTSVCTSDVRPQVGVNSCAGPMANEMNGWIKPEVFISFDKGIYGERAWDGRTNDWGWFLDGVPNSTLGGWNTVKSFTIGGFHRVGWCGSPAGGDYLNVNNFRYFDDIYIDNTFSRVVLTNNSVYESSTLIEPQIPSAWSNNSISVKVNRGRLSDGRVYLFVFDANNNHNLTGIPVGVPVSGDTTPPTAPSGGR